MAKWMMGLAAKFKEMLNINILFSIGIGLVIVMLMSLAALVEIQNEEQDFVVNIDTNGQLLHLLVYQSMRDNTGVSEGHPLDDIVPTLNERNDLSYFQVLSPQGEVLKESESKAGSSELAGNTDLRQAFQDGDSLQQFAENDYEVIQPVIVNSELVGFTRFGFNVEPLQAEKRQIIVKGIVLTAIIVGLGASIPYLVARRNSRSMKNDTESSHTGQADLAGGVDPSLEWEMQSAKMDAVGQLAYGMAHEINNPLASILGFAQLGKQKIVALRNASVEAKEVSTLERYLEYIEKEAKRSADLIRRLLSFSLSPDLEMARTDINDLLEQSIKMNVNQLAMCGITPELHLADDVPLVEGHTASLIQAFDHIIANAVTAMPEGGVLKVTSRFLNTDSGIVEISFADTGVGIPEENISKVFEPFFTTSGSGRAKTGLGMYACYQIVRQHNGETAITSRQGEGTTVTMRFPVPVDDSEARGFLEP